MCVKFWHQKKLCGFCPEQYNVEYIHIFYLYKYNCGISADCFVMNYFIKYINKYTYFSL